MCSLKKTKKNHFVVFGAVWVSGKTPQQRVEADIFKPLAGVTRSSAVRTAAVVVLVVAQQQQRTTAAAELQASDFI